MVDATGEEIGDGFLAAVRVVGESGALADGEVVEHQEGGEVAQFGSADGSAHAGAGAFGLFDGMEDLADGARGGHVGKGWDDW